MYAEKYPEWNQLSRRIFIRLCQSIYREIDSFNVTKRNRNIKTATSEENTIAVLANVKHNSHTINCIILLHYLELVNSN